jgi:DNA-binding LacI/PurR family transcriptional regulator
MGIRSIAQEANVSIATVSRVLNTPLLVKQHTRDKVLRIAKEQEYKKYDSSFSNTKSKDEIGVIIPDVLNTFFARVLEGILKKSRELDFTVTLQLSHDNDEEELEAVDKLIDKHIKGIILIRSRNKELESIKTIKKMQKYNIPFVLVDRDISNSSYSGVFLSNANSVYDGISLLIKDGYKNISFITGPSNNQNSNQRLEGYKEALNKHDISYDEKHIYRGDFSMESGLEITRKILQEKNLPDAIFCCANQITVGSIKAINEKGLIIGKDIKLFSFNKLESSYLNNFNISYVEHPVEDMGSRSITILKNKFVGPQVLIREIVNYKIHY